MTFDTLIVNAGRLRILTALAVENRQEFVRLRAQTHLTDGNLSAHARRLHAAGLIEIEKHFRDGKPVTTFHLNDEGRQRLNEHARLLLRAVDGTQAAESAAELQSVSASSDDDWVD
jgi:DNA-binding MarR family transcriptional regulator